MKPPANRLGMYSDVRQILDAALAAGGGSYECGSYGQAVHWRQRAYKFRKLFAETIGLDDESKYDQLTMPRIESDCTTVVIKVRQQVGIFKPTADPIPANLLLGDDLLGDALEFAKTLENKP